MPGWMLPPSWSALYPIMRASTKPRRCQRPMPVSNSSKRNSWPRVSARSRLRKSRRRWYSLRAKRVAAPIWKRELTMCRIRRPPRRRILLHCKSSSEQPRFLRRCKCNPRSATGQECLSEFILGSSSQRRLIGAKRASNRHSRVLSLPVSPPANSDSRGSGNPDIRSSMAYGRSCFRFKKNIFLSPMIRD